MCFIIWILLIVLYKIDSYLMRCCSLLEVLNQNFNFKFHQMNFWFEFLDIHMNEKVIPYHYFHGFKWQNINIYPILIIFLYNLMLLLTCWIMITPKGLPCFFAIANNLLIPNAKASNLKISPRATTTIAWNNFENLKDGSPSMKHPEKCS